MGSIGLCGSPRSSEAKETVRRHHPESMGFNTRSERGSEELAGGDANIRATEAALLSKAKDGDHQAFVELCNRHSRCLKGRIFRIVRNYEDAEDVYQETLMRAYEHLKGFMGKCAFQTWITQIAINTALMLLRRQRVSASTLGGLMGREGEILEFPEVVDSEPNPEQSYFRVERDLIVSTAVRRLPAGFRTLMDLYYFEENSLFEVAQALGMTEGAAKSRLTRARALLRRRLGHHPLMGV